MLSVGDFGINGLAVGAGLLGELVSVGRVNTCCGFELGVDVVSTGFGVTDFGVTGLDALGAAVFAAGAVGAVGVAGFCVNTCCDSDAGLGATGLGVVVGAAVTGF